MIVKNAQNAFDSSRRGEDMDTQTETTQLATKNTHDSVDTIGTSTTGCVGCGEAPYTQENIPVNTRHPFTKTAPVQRGPKIHHVDCSTARQGDSVGPFSPLCSNSSLRLEQLSSLPPPPSDLLRLVALVDEPREYVAVVDGEVVPLAVDVGRDDRCEVAPVLILLTHGGGSGTNGD